MLNTNQVYKQLLYLLIAGLSTIASCDSSDKEEKEEIDLIEVSDSNIRLTTEQFESANMELGKISKHVFYQSIKSYGVIDVPPENKASVSAYFGGYVKKLVLVEGQSVKEGDILFTLENPAYIEIQQDFLESKGQLTYLQSDYERQKNLVKDNVTSQKKYLKAEADYKVTLVHYESLKKKLSLMNIDPNSLDEYSIQSEIELTSPLSGTITKVNATRGMFLNPDDIALTIINADHIHLELNIFEKDLQKINKGQKILFRLQSDSEKEYEAYVYIVGNYIDAEKRSAPIHGHLVDEDESHLFIPGMYIEAEILSSSDTLMAIDQDAIITVNNKNFILQKIRVEGDESIYTKREVLVGLNKDGFSQILNINEFSEDDEFLVKGGFNLIGE